MPPTADLYLWERAVAIGQRVLWLHTYGERYADEVAGRPYGRVLLPRDRPQGDQGAEGGIGRRRRTIRPVSGAAGQLTVLPPPVHQPQTGGRTCPR
ncbi:hypothetical protein [Streptomyces sp. NBC_00457]|uniref:hypothetical protein n=1 Tax=Streptomyces sp. NBC_00457 TaxID=2975748 RepID=UPI003FCD7C25